jgi:hypothetical protein
MGFFFLMNMALRVKPLASGSAPDLDAAFYEKFSVLA